jgi:hypothetical protein
MFAAAVGRHWNSSLGILASSTPTAQRKLAPVGCWSSLAEEDGGLNLFRNSSICI